MDPHVHKCCEDPTDHILDTVNRHLERSMPLRSDTQERGTRALPVMMETPIRRSNIMHQETDDEISDLEGEVTSNDTSTKSEIRSSQISEHSMQLDVPVGHLFEDSGSCRHQGDGGRAQ